MSWAKLDDRYDDNPKIKRAWKRHPASVGLHAMAVTYACRHELDGVVELEWVEERMPVKREREQVCAVLVEVGLFEDHPAGYLIHDFLDFNPSRAVLRERREKDRARKETKAGTATFRAESERNPDGIQTDSARPRAYPRAQAGTGRVEGLQADERQQPRLTRERVDEAVSILAAIERWQVDEVGVENAAATEPEGDLLRASHLAVSWASDPGWTMGAAATLRAALRKLTAERPKESARSKRGAALSSLMARTEGAA